MIDFAVLFWYIGAVVIFLATPGPVTLLVANTGVKYGVSASIKTILGTNFASLILIACSFFIIQGLFEISENLLSYLSLLGGLYLIYLAVAMLREPVHLDNETDTVKTRNHFKHGFILGISSPKDVLFFIGFFPVFFTVADNPYIAIVLLTLAWMVCDFTVLTLYALVFSKLINDNIAGIVSKVSGAVLLLIAAYAFYHGATTLKG